MRGRGALWNIAVGSVRWSGQQALSPKVSPEQLHLMRPQKARMRANIVATAATRRGGADLCVSFLRAAGPGPACPGPLKSVPPLTTSVVATIFFQLRAPRGRIVTT